MKRTAIVRRSALRAKTAMKRTAMRRHRATLSAAERRAYRDSLEAAREPDGTIICALCHLPILEGTEHRHHRIHRSQGGKTEVSNIAVCHAACHMRAHGERVRL